MAEYKTALNLSRLKYKFKHFVAVKMSALVSLSINTRP